MPETQEKAREVAGQAQDRAREAAGQARGRVSQEVDRRSTQAGEQVSSNASDARWRVDRASRHPRRRVTCPPTQVPQPPSVWRPCRPDTYTSGIFAIPIGMTASSVSAT
jgi:hypothetical protein